MNICALLVLVYLVGSAGIVIMKKLQPEDKIYPVWVAAICVIKTSEIIMTAIVWVFAIAGIAITQKLEPHNKIYTVWIGLTVVVYMLLVALKLIS